MAKDADLFGQVVIQPQQILAAGRRTRQLGLVIVGGARRKVGIGGERLVGQRIEVQQCLAGRPDPVRRNDVSGKELTVGRVVYLDQLVVGGADALAEIALPLQRRGHRHVMRGVRHQLLLPFLAPEEEQLAFRMFHFFNGMGPPMV